MTRRLFAIAISLVASSNVMAEERPPFPPAAPYEAQVRFSNGMTGTLRYQDGRLRVDASGDTGPSTAYIDLENRTAIVIVAMRGMNMALDVDLDEFQIPDLRNTPAEKIGLDTVAGESCDVWRMSDVQTAKSGVACMTADGIPLSAGEAGMIPVMMATKVNRGVQKASDLQPPRGLVTIKASGLGNLPFAIPGLKQ